MELYGNIWTVIESLGFLTVVVIFFLDPVRRWNFFGYRPTAVLGLFDPYLEKVLMVEVREASGTCVWSFNQGGIYDNNIHVTVSDVLHRELGIDETRFKLLYTEPLGTLRIKDSLIIKRARISTISIFPQLRGKGYLACYVRSNLKDVEDTLALGEGVTQVRAVDIAEARELVCSVKGAEHSPKKQAMMLAMLERIEQRIHETKARREARASTETPAEVPTKTPTEAPQDQS